MPDIPYIKLKPQSPPASSRTSFHSVHGAPHYAELEAISNFSFLRGGSHPEELITTAANLGYRAISITDFHSLSGVVRAHQAARHLPIQFIVGCRLLLKWKDTYTFTALVYPRTRKAYGALCRLLTLGNRRAPKGSCFLNTEDFLQYHAELVTTLVPPSNHSISDQYQVLAFSEFARAICDGHNEKHLLSIAISRDYGHRERNQASEIQSFARYLNIPLVATGNIYYHAPDRRPLQDVLTCIREKTNIESAGLRLLQNSERWLKPPSEISRLFREFPGACTRTLEIAELCKDFSLDQLRYEYPEEVCPAGKLPIEYLGTLVQEGALRRYPKERLPEGVPAKVQLLIKQELALIQELNYEKYFLTCYDIVRFARSRGILCQGRGAAANSAVCFCLEITSVDPAHIDLLFARFISKERNEPPDIDIDFEHERREEVIQYIYERFGRERAGLTCEVITYRYRSAVRDVGKALGLPHQVVDKLAKTIHRWSDYAIPTEELRTIGLNPSATAVQNTFLLAQQLCSFPRHLSQHVGGFIISQAPLCETVPIGNAGMASRTIIEWDKDDIEALGMLKIDVLALGMLTCIRKALSMVNHRLLHSRSSLFPLELHSIPAEDPHVYDMICRADTIGVFQIESRAQMSMLPRLKPRCFYDLVIEVAIVRPGPIQGNMVHPFLKRRAGIEPVSFPDQRVADILGKTLGVPIFQEQAMRLAIVLAQFSPGEAEQLRRAMAAWKRDKGVIATFKKRIVDGMQKSGYSPQFAQHCMNQIKGFSEYGFPESHAASFALLVYASAWLKYHFPAEFAASLLNSQPMGFYSSSQIVRDVQEHAVDVREVDVNQSNWDSKLEYQDDFSKAPALRLGMRLVKGLPKDQALLIQQAREGYGAFSSIQDLWHKLHLSSRGNASHSITPRKLALTILAEADGFTSMRLSQRQALWEIRSLPDLPTRLDAVMQKHETSAESQVTLPLLSQQHAMFQDYRLTGLSLRAHPLQFVRAYLNGRGASTAQALKSRPLATLRGSKADRYVKVAGIAIVRQRPGTAKGVVFVTLEDETGIANLIIRPEIFDLHRSIILSSSSLLAEGTLDRVGEVVYVSITRLESLDSMVLVDERPNFPNLSYSY